MQLTVYDKFDIPHLITIYNAKTLPIDDVMRNVQVVKNRNNSYYNIPCAFDIETTSIPVSKIDTNGKETYKDSYGFMYIWQFCIGNTVCFGRTWKEFKLLMDRLSQYTAGTLVKFVVYSHFLPFEFQFMKEFIDITSIFARKKHSPMMVRTPDVEFRCSYYLSNQSLENFCKNSKLCTFFKKDKKSYDYEKVRTIKTKLTQEELEYCYCDVRGLCQCIYSLMEHDTLATIPMTSTGFVRREFKDAVQSNPKNRKLMQKQALSYNQYILAKKIIRGGNTHALVINSNMIHDNVWSYDLKSSYPACMLLDRVPVTRFIPVTINSQDKFDKYINTKACMFTFIARDVQLKSLDCIPYIDKAHIRNDIDGKFDNGRVLMAKQIEMSVTDVDWRIIRNQYEFKKGFIVTEMHIAGYGMLPLEFREHLLYYFKQKCELEYELKVTLKNEKGTEKWHDVNYRLAKFKNRINGAYGMMVTDILSPDITYDSASMEWEENEVDGPKALARYYRNSKSFLSYQHGMWVVANARKRLQDMLDIVKHNVIYNDTDSVKGTGDYAKEFARVNDLVKKQIEENELDIAVHINEKSYYIGTWEEEEPYDKFKTMGAKKYCYEIEGKAYVTVSGLGKYSGSDELNRGNGIHDFKEHKVFTDSGRTTHFYRDEKIHTITIDGVEMETGSSIAVLPATYTLGLSSEYRDLLGEYDIKTFIPKKAGV